MPSARISGGTMNCTGSRSNRWWSLLLCAVLFACGSDGGGNGGETVLTGSLVLPPPNQCAGCSTANRTTNVLALNQNAAPRLVTTIQTDSQGRYVTPGLNNLLLGSRSLILVASVSQTAGLGGVESVHGGTNAKDFNVYTQVACQAAVFLTTGDAGNGTACGAFATLDPSLVDDTRIRNLEQAATLIADRVNLSTDVGRAACAVINCTFAGAAAASPECMAGAF
jgi:hypothetical protein